MNQVEQRVKRIEKSIGNHTRRIKSPLQFYKVPEDDRARILEENKKARDYANIMGVSLDDWDAYQEIVQILKGGESLKNL